MIVAVRPGQIRKLVTSSQVIEENISQIIHHSGVSFKNPSKKQIETKFVLVNDERFVASIKNWMTSSLTILAYSLHVTSTALLEHNEHRAPPGCYRTNFTLWS